jgi:4-amino-4-deoxy-L-arabinose transferase-like glycosyltransferase
VSQAPEGASRDGRSRRDALLLTFVLLVAAWIQLTVVNRTVVEGPVRADAADYFSYAFNLREFGIYSAAKTWRSGERPPAPEADKLRSPGYPLFLAAVGRPALTDAYLHRVVLWQAAFGVLSVWLAYLIAAHFLPPGGALAVAVVSAVNPHLSTISTYLLTESLFTLLLLASVLLSLRAWRAGGIARWLFAGVAWGLCCLVRPTLQFFPLLLVVAAFVVPALRSQRRGIAACVLAFLLVLAPWGLRNAGVPAAPGTSLMANSIAHGSYPSFMYADRPESFGFPYRFDPTYPVYSQSLGGVMRDIGRRASEQPLRYLAWYAGGKPGWFLSWGNVQAVDVLIYPVLHSPYYEDVRFVWLRMLSMLAHWPLMLLGIAGAVIAVVRPAWLRLDPLAQAAAVLVAAVVLYAVALHVVAAPFPRYSIPFRPLLYALALLWLHGGWRALSARRAHSGSVSASQN